MILGIVRKAAVVSTLLLACACGRPTPDPEMVSAPTGVWIGTQRADLTLEIESGGSLKLVQSGREQLGTWRLKDPTTLEASLGGAVFALPFVRRDLSLRITLPNETTPTEFGQM